VDGVFEEGADDVEGTVDGADEGFDVGRTEGAEEDEGIDVGYDDVDGLVEGMKEEEGMDEEIVDGFAEGVDVHDIASGWRGGMRGLRLDCARFEDGA